MNDLYIRSQSFEDVFVPTSYTLTLGKDPSSLGDAGEVMSRLETKVSNSIPKQERPCGFNIVQIDLEEVGYGL